MTRHCQTINPRGRLFPTEGTCSCAIQIPTYVISTFKPFSVELTMCNCTILLLVYHNVDRLPPFPTTLNFSLVVGPSYGRSAQTVSVSVALSDQSRCIVPHYPFANSLILLLTLCSQQILVSPVVSHLKCQEVPWIWCFMSKSQLHREGDWRHNTSGCRSGSSQSHTPQRLQHFHLLTC